MRAQVAAGPRAVRVKIVMDAIDRFVNGRRIAIVSDSIADQAGLANDQLAELIGRNGAPLRVWINRDKALLGIRLGAKACEVLQVHDGEAVIIRAPLA